MSPLLFLFCHPIGQSSLFGAESNQYLGWEGATTLRKRRERLQRAAKPKETKKAR